MSNKKILVVCEGPTDFIFLEGIVNHLGQSLRKSFTISMLSPQVDATSGKPESQGWPGVKRWCELYAKKDESKLVHLPEPIKQKVLRQSWEALLLFSNADLLLVQLDTDIANHIEQNFDESKQSRRDCCKKNICLWLGLESETPNCRYVLPTFAIETWLLATYDSKDNGDIFNHSTENYEMYSNYEDMLISLGYQSKNVRSRRRLVKNPQKYKYNNKYLPRLLSNFTAASNRCPELLNFKSLLEQL